MPDKQKVIILNKDGINNSGILSYTGVWDKKNLWDILFRFFFFASIFSFPSSALICFRSPLNFTTRWVLHVPQPLSAF